MKEDKKAVEATYEQDLKDIEQKPTKKSRKARHSNPTAEDIAPIAVEEEKVTSCPTLEDLDALPLKTYDDYIAYNSAIRRRRRSTRKKDAEFLYCPMDVVPTVKVRLTRTSNKSLPININLRRLKDAVWFQSPKKGYKHGDEVDLPKCLVDVINTMAEPIYKQMIYPDGSYSTVLDYMDNKYSCQIIMGD